MILPIGLNSAFPVCWQCGERHSMFDECKAVTRSRKQMDTPERVTDFLAKYEDFVRWYYGERCEDDEKDCCVCQAWKAFDKFADDVMEKEPV